MKPAWSEAFTADALRPVVPLGVPITKEWAWGDATGAGVDVAVIDSGVDAGHPAVGSVERAVAVTWNADTEEANFAEGPHEDLYGHGTACAGIIRRAAPDCRIWSVRVLGERLTGKGIVFGHALDWVIEQGVRVANISLSTGREEYYAMFHELADRAYFHGTVLVCAVNNVPAPTYPSEFSSVISVAASEETDPFTVLCNPEPPVEFGAPGIEIEVPWLNQGTITTTGNSFAAPHVTGLVARMLSKHPDMTPYDVKTVLRAVASNAKSS